ncbi:MAG: SagB/ThcOx family dehydrogenase [Thermodesulfobacteriota bacterium]
MDRRDFLRRSAAMSVGLLAVIRAGKIWAKGLPSDPGGATSEAPSPESILLPPFEKDMNFTLDRALLERKSTRSFVDRPLSREELSRLLWATTGVNREDGHRTTPSAQAKYPVDILAALPEGVYRYEPKEHRLVRILSEDIREKIPNQDLFKKAAMIVLYVINKDKTSRIEWADLEIGCMGQNLYLESAALGMGSRIFAGVKVNEVTRILGLKESQILRIAQAAGPIK